MCLAADTFLFLQERVQLYLALKRFRRWYDEAARRANATPMETNEIWDWDPSQRLSSQLQRIYSSYLGTPSYHGDI